MGHRMHALSPLLLVVTVLATLSWARPEPLAASDDNIIFDEPSPSRAEPDLPKELKSLPPFPRLDLAKLPAFPTLPPAADVVDGVAATKSRLNAGPNEIITSEKQQRQEAGYFYERPEKPFDGYVYDKPANPMTLPPFTTTTTSTSTPDTEIIDLPDGSARILDDEKRS